MYGNKVTGSRLEKDRGFIYRKTCPDIFPREIINQIEQEEAPPSGLMEFHTEKTSIILSQNLDPESALKNLTRRQGKDSFLQPELRTAAF